MIRTTSPLAREKPVRAKSRQRSTGCKTCRLRKVKCDEAKPICKNCMKSQRTCLGYKQVDDLVFKDENGKFQQKFYDPLLSHFHNPDIQTWQRDIYDTPHTDDSYASTPYSIQRTNSMSDVSSLTDFSRPLDLRHSDSFDETEQSLIIPTTVPTSTYRLETFFFQRFIGSVWLHSQADAWRHYLPLVLNSSPALYHSVMSLSALYMFKSGVDLRAKEVALQHYQVTLKYLQSALSNPRVMYDDTTLMGIVIIGLYEFMDKSNTDSWCSHARGTAELMRLRGAENCRSGMGRTLFLTLRGFEVVRAILQGDSTFIADLEWTRLTASPRTIKSANGILGRTEEDDPEPTDYSAILFMLGGRTANLQALCGKLRKSGELEGRREELLGEAKGIEGAFHTWRGSLPQAFNGKERPSALLGSPYATYQEFETLLMGFQLSFYAAFILLLHRTTRKFLGVEGNRGDQDYARFILKTAEFMNQGLTTASLNITWAIYMASISLLDERERAWARDMLDMIAREKGWQVASAALLASTKIHARR